MQTRLLEHLHNNNNLSVEQYGFRTKLTTGNATYKLTNEVINVMNNKLIVEGIFCDPKKAFDCVNHVSRDSSVGIATRYELTVRGSNPGRGEIFSTPPDRP